MDENKIIIREEDYLDTNDMDSFSADDEEKEEYVRGTDEKENNIEWYTGSDRVTATISQRKVKNKIRKLKEKYPDEVEIVVENDDGTMLAHFPLSYVYIRHPRIITEEQRKAMSERGKINVANGTFGKRKG